MNLVLLYIDFSTFLKVEEKGDATLSSSGKSISSRHLRCLPKDYCGHYGHFKQYTYVQKIALKQHLTFIFAVQVL